MRAAAIAAADHDRAVTHNKGVLNGIAALTQATGNDTRAVEAADHGWAAAGAGYAPLTGYHVANGALHCRLQCPLPLGTVGGAVGVHPVSRRRCAFWATRTAAGWQPLRRRSGWPRT